LWLGHSVDLLDRSRESGNGYIKLWGMLLGRRDKYFTHVVAKLRGGSQARRKLDQAEVLNHESSTKWAKIEGERLFLRVSL